MRKHSSVTGFQPDYEPDWRRSLHLTPGTCVAGRSDDGRPRALGNGERPGNEHGPGSFSVRWLAPLRGGAGIRQISQSRMATALTGAAVVLTHLTGKTLSLNP